MKKAKALFEKAESAAAQREYVPSADYYLDAYALFPSSDFIFNAASMYRLANEKELARKYFQEYLSVDPKGRGAAEATSALALYEAERKNALERERQAKQKAAAKARKKRKRNTAAIDGEKKTTAADDSGSNGQPSRLPALVGMSTGVLLVGVGVYFGFESRSISKEVSNRLIFDPDLEKKGEEAERNAYIFGGIGAAVLLGSAVFYVVRSRSDSSDNKVTLVPAINNESVGAFVSGRF